MVDEIYNDYAAKKMGIDHKGQVCVMIHSGSRGLGHQVATGRRGFPPNCDPMYPPHLYNYPECFWGGLLAYQ